jgi:predicted nucleic acid-binding protein
VLRKDLDRMAALVDDLNAEMYEKQLEIDRLELKKSQKKVEKKKQVEDDDFLNKIDRMMGKQRLNV